MSKYHLFLLFTPSVFWFFYFSRFSCQAMKPKEKQSFCGVYAEPCLTKRSLISTCGTLTCFCSRPLILTSQVSFSKLERKIVVIRRDSQQTLWRWGGLDCNRASLYLDVACVFVFFSWAESMKNVQYSHFKHNQSKAVSAGLYLHLLRLIPLHKTTQVYLEGGFSPNPGAVCIETR